MFRGETLLFIELFYIYELVARYKLFSFLIFNPLRTEPSNTFSTVLRYMWERIFPNFGI